MIADPRMIKPRNVFFAVDDRYMVISPDDYGPFAL
jgi:hypothetical protein